MEGGPPDFNADSTCPHLLRILPARSTFRLQDCHFLRSSFPARSPKSSGALLQSFTPQVFLPAVWPLSLSLATTHEISVDFFSSSYLDVSVRKVPSPQLWIYCGVARHDSCGVSPFGHLRIKAYLPLPEAYRSLSRPSSAPNAKAFSLCSSSLELSLRLLSQTSFLT